MKILYIIIFVAIVASCSKAPNQPSGDVTTVIEQINDDTTKQLGIGLRALNELTDISDITFTSESTMPPQVLADLKDLETAGYISIVLGDAPSGMSTGIKFYRIQKTLKGQALAKAVSRL